MLSEFPEATPLPRRIASNTDSAGLHHSLQEHIGLALSVLQEIVRIEIQATDTEIAAKRRNDPPVESPATPPLQSIPRSRAQKPPFILWLPLGMATWCAILAFVEFDSLWPYQLSRWALCSGSAILAVRFGPSTWRGIVACILAVLFNPIAPIHFGDAWPVVDCLSAISLIVISPNVANFRIQDWVRRGRALYRIFTDWLAKLFVVLLIIFGVLLLVHTIWDVASGNMETRDREKVEREKDRWKFKTTIGLDASRAILEAQREDERAKNSDFWIRFMQRAKQERAAGSKGTSADGSRIARELMLDESTDTKK